VIDPIAMTALSELARRDRNISWLAGKVGLDRNVLSRWLSGRRSIRLDRALAVLDALELDVTVRPRGSLNGKAGLHRSPFASSPPGADRRDLR
jgi:DNA-binding phage protein